MKLSKVTTGISLVLLSVVGAVYSTSSHTQRTVWYDNDGFSATTQIEFTACNPGEPTCLGTHGPSEGKPLYDDQFLTIALEQR